MKNCNQQTWDKISKLKCAGYQYEQIAQILKLDSGRHAAEIHRALSKNTNRPCNGTPDYYHVIVPGKEDEYFYCDTVEQAREVASKLELPLRVIGARLYEQLSSNSSNTGTAFAVGYRRAFRQLGIHISEWKCKDCTKENKKKCLHKTIPKLVYKRRRGTRGGKGKSRTNKTRKTK